MSNEILSPPSNKTILKHKPMFLACLDHCAGPRHTDSKITVPDSCLVIKEVRGKGGGENGRLGSMGEGNGGRGIERGQ